MSVTGEFTQMKIVKQIKATNQPPTHTHLKVTTTREHSTANEGTPTPVTSPPLASDTGTENKTIRKVTLKPKHEITQLVGKPNQQNK